MKTTPENLSTANAIELRDVVYSEALHALIALEKQSLTEALLMLDFAAMELDPEIRQNAFRLRTELQVWEDFEKLLASARQKME